MSDVSKPCTLADLQATQHWIQEGAAADFAEGILIAIGTENPDADREAAATAAYNAAYGLTPAAKLQAAIDTLNQECIDLPGPDVW